MNTNLLFSLSNLFYLIGTAFLIRRVIKNRYVLNDFDIYGSLINFVGMLINVTALIEIDSYMAVIISAPTIVFWAMTAAYSYRNRDKKI